jgi:MFS family permease
MTLIFMQILLFFGIIYSTSTGAIITFFIIQAAVISLIGLSLDIFLEAYTDGMHAGTVRGLYTATLNASWVIGPLIGSMILDDGSDYKKTYIVALAMLFPLLYLIHKNFPRFKDPNYTHPSLWHLIKHVSHHHSWVRVFYANVVLQIFYSWMTIYVPIYLHKTLGFGWEDLGIIFVAMLLPFPTIQYPLGKLADKKYGEKEIMCAGFAIMGIATVALSFIGTPNIWLWSIGLFTTRIGAAAVEIMLETYFFKTVSSTDTPVLGLFRMTRPLSTFLTPLIPLTALYFWPNLEYPWMFVIVGLFTLLALIPAITLKDTK